MAWRKPILTVDCRLVLTPERKENTLKGLKMFLYAMSLACFGKLMTPALAEAFSHTAIREVEISLEPYVESTPETRISRRLTAELLKKGVIRAASAHLPFCGGERLWDPSELDETLRRQVVDEFAELLRNNRELLAPQITIHANSCSEPPQEEHARRLDAVCCSLEELLPLAEEFGFTLNVEYLPRTCVGNCVAELERITGRFDARQVGICMDVNHCMGKYREVPEMIAQLAPRINTFHLSDYDGVDEMHWLPGQGILDWPEIMTQIRALTRDVTLIFETQNQLGTKASHVASPAFGLRQLEQTCFFLENCQTLVPQMKQFKITAPVHTDICTCGNNQ